MSHNRKIEYLNKHRIIYRRLPDSDKPTKIYDWGMYYEDGTYQCYDLFKSKAKITTYRSFKWHLLVIWYLNPKLSQDKFENISSFIADKSNGFITFSVSDNILSSIMHDVSMSDLDEPPSNKLRKIIFNDFPIIKVEEKLKIVGQIIGRSKKIEEDDIYQCMLDINDAGKKITISGIAKLLGCSTRTIHRNTSNSLKKEKELLNQQL